MSRQPFVRNERLVAGKGENHIVSILNRKKMNAKQQQESKRLDQILMDYTQKKTAYSVIPALATAMEQLLSNQQHIKIVITHQVKDLTGFTQNKNDLKTVLSDRAFQVAGGISSWTEDTNNLEIQKQVNITISAMYTLTDKMILAVCQNIYDIAKANLSDLANYGIDEENLKELEDAISNFNANSSIPRNQIINRSGETKTLSLIFKEVKKIIKTKTDKLILKLKDKDTATYLSYTAVSAMPQSAPTPPKVKPDTPKNKLDLPKDTPDIPPSI